MDLILLCHREASAHRICSSILTCEAHTRCHILRVATFCFVCYSFLFPVFFQRVVLLLTESTRWQQNAFKYLLDCHHSLYPFINSVCAPTLKRAYYSYCCILGSLFGDLSHLLHHSYSCQRTIDRVWIIGITVLKKWCIVWDTSKVIFLCHHIGPASVPASDSAFQDKVRSSRKK